MVRSPASAAVSTSMRRRRSPATTRASTHSSAYKRRGTRSLPLHRAAHAARVLITQRADHVQNESQIFADRAGPISTNRSVAGTMDVWL